jgi:hypothetical protein
MLNGNGALDTSTHRLVDRVRGDRLPLPEPAERFAELAAAVRRHESGVAHRAVPKRPADHALYRMLTELERD